MPAQIERDIVTLAKESELEHKNIDDLLRERDLLNTNLRRTQKAVVKFEASRTSHRGWAHPRPHLHRDWARPRPHLHQDSSAG